MQNVKNYLGLKKKMFLQNLMTVIKNARKIVKVLFKVRLKKFMTVEKKIKILKWW